MKRATGSANESTFEALLQQGKRISEANRSYYSWRRSGSEETWDRQGCLDLPWLTYGHHSDPFGISSERPDTCGNGPRSSEPSNGAQLAYLSTDDIRQHRSSEDVRRKNSHSSRNRIARTMRFDKTHACRERGTSLETSSMLLDPSFPSTQAHRRTNSADTIDVTRNMSPDLSRLGSVDFFNITKMYSLGGRMDVQKNILKNDIETRRLKLSSRFGSLLPPQTDLSDLSDLVEKKPELPLKKLFVITSRLPVKLFYDEDSGSFSHERDPFEKNVADVIAEVRQNPKVSRLEVASAAEKVSEVILVGAPVLRRKTDGGIMGISEDLQDGLSTFLRNELNMVPVFTPPNRDRFAARVVFPLFHYSAPSVETGLGSFDWEGYELVNECFRDVVIKEYSRGDLVWINDYSLMLLPKMLRKERPDIHIGFYMDIVFPSSEVYRILPQREELLRGVLSANVIALHTFQYVRHFLTSCTRVLGLECTASGIEACEEAGGTCTKVVAVPLGIDLSPYKRLLHEEETQNRIGELQRIFHREGKKILVALDHLEEKKGIPHKIMAFHRFLQKEPKWATKCVFVQIVETIEDIASDESSEAAADSVGGHGAQALLEQVYQMVGECNSKFGTIGHLPVHFICQNFNHVDHTALVVNADVLIDTPLRDMLSRSAQMFLCCQEAANCGALILSEFSGNAQSLRASALCVNPWDTNAFADAIQEALEMTPNEKMELHRYGHRFVTDYTMTQWALNFLDEFHTAVDECERERLEIPPPLDHEKAVADLRKAKRRVIILGFSGTLLPRKNRINTKVNPRLPEVLLANLQVIAEEPNTDVIVFSGVARQALELALGEVPCWIIAEGGLCYREPTSQEEWHTSEPNLDVTEWMQPVQEIMQYFAARTPGSTVIQTPCSVSWHYQKTQGDHAAIQSKDMLIHLWAGPLMSSPAEVVVGNDSVSVRPTGISKASMLETILKRICCVEDEDKPSQWLNNEAFIMCISDLTIRDEDAFTTVQKFFECEGGERPERRSQNDAIEFGDRGGKILSEREVEELNLEANSKSLSEIYGRLSSTALSKLEFDDGPFGGQKSALDTLFNPSPPLLTKHPSEPDITALQQDIAPQLSDSNGDIEDDSAAMYTCTVSRKATRAAYHLSDSNDVAFLIAQFAREFRRGANDCEGIVRPM